MSERRFATAVAALVCAGLVVTSCGDGADETPTSGDDTSPAAAPTTPSDPDESPESDGETPDASASGRLERADVLITSGETLPDDLVAGIEGLGRVSAVERISYGSAPVEGRALVIAGVDPGGFRRFTPVETFEADDVWDRVAGGEVALDPSVPKRILDGENLTVRAADEEDSSVHIGAYAPLSNPFYPKPTFSAVVSDERAEALGIPQDNALLVSTKVTPSKIKKELEQIVGDRANIQLLALEFDNPVQLAVLTGASVSNAVGSFSYRNGPDGTVIPDQAWVDEYIRTEEVPILGTVRCNKAMLPQLRAAFTEIVARGLADKINPDEYAGCYYPRYIGRSAANGLSLHSWGIAVDLNVPGNLRGTVGEMDRTVVSIFKKWGFSWGGDWNYTDPMHFEMSRVVAVG